MSWVWSVCVVCASGRVDDISTALDIHLNDVLSFEKVLLDSVGLPIVSRRTLHRQLQDAIAPDGGCEDMLTAAQYLGLLTMSHLEMVQTGVRYCSRIILAVMRRDPVATPALPPLVALHRARLLPHTLLSLASLRIVEEVLGIEYGTV